MITQQSTRSSKILVFVICLFFRLINVHFTQTYDNPDEYWQSQEVAHHLVFGYGYLTWEWQEQIRSYAHPLILAVIYKIIQLFGLDDTYLLIAAPRYFQGILSAVADYATYTLGKKVIGNSLALSILFMTLCSWFNFMMAGRTLSNTIETALTIIALNYWPIPHVTMMDKDQEWLKRYRVSLIFALIACIVRPTNGLIWLFLGLYTLIIYRHNRIQIAINACVMSTIILSLNIALDTYLYQTNKPFTLETLVFTPYTFFKVNVVNSVSLFYGIHTWHWYISQGIPVMTTTLLPIILFGLYCIWSNDMIYNRMKALLYLSVWIIAIYSLLPHKEFRFLYPLMPILLIIGAYGLNNLTFPKYRKWLIILLLLTQIPMALYFCLYHQRGVIDVMLWLRNESQKPNDYPISVGVLMPCHSTPWYSVIHNPNVPMWFLTCEPPLNGSNDLDEADQFYLNPVQYLQEHKDDREWSASHIILFENLLPVLEGYLKDQGYTECRRFFNSHFHDDKRRKGDIVVMCHSQNK
ncbi:Alg9-like mannosyltransferase family-domain-containing protein [Pilobolus umbonatus]|nr:Alg9-like mannosyltransferase family-domain-containing protein [Pilobolus umbonatus]